MSSVPNNTSNTLLNWTFWNSVLLHNTLEWPDTWCQDICSHVHIFPVKAAWGSYHLHKIARCACAGNTRNVSLRGRCHRKPLVKDSDMHHGTCVTHVPWCMSGSLTCGGGKTFPAFSAHAHPQFYASGPWQNTIYPVLRLVDTMHCLIVNSIYRYKTWHCTFTDYPLLMWWLWRYLYILLSSSDLKYELLHVLMWSFSAIDVIPLNRGRTNGSVISYGFLKYQQHWDALLQF